MTTEETLRDRVKALSAERDYLLDLLKACQIVGFLPESLGRVVNGATAEESEGGIQRRRDNADAIIGRTIR